MYLGKVLNNLGGDAKLEMYLLQLSSDEAASTFQSLALLLLLLLLL